MALSPWFIAIIISLSTLLGSGVQAVADEPVEVVVEGIEGDALANVKEALVLPSGLVREGKADRLWVEHFTRGVADKALTALEPYGYYSARVEAGMETVAEGEYRIRVRVEPGEPVRIAELEVAVRGSGDDSLKDEVAAFPLHKGDVLLQREYEEAKGKLLSRARELAYLDAAFSRHEIRIDSGRTSARIALVLETGERYSFDGVTVEGAPDYPERFLRRYLAFKSGDVFSQAKLGETQLNFANSERFKSVVITPEKETAQDLQVPVRVQLTPAPRWSLKPGIGYGTDTGARASIRYRDLNLFHRGHDLNVMLYAAERLQGLGAVYTLPGYRDIRSFTSLQLNLQHEDVTTYESNLLTAEVNRNRSFGDRRLGTAFVRLLLEDYTVGDQKSSSRLLMPGVRFSENRFDNLIRPAGGYRYVLEVRGAHEALGSDTKLLQVVADGSWLMPLPWRFTLRTRANLGVTLVSDPVQNIPPSVRFFAGGDRSVRGYSYQSLGPRDADGNVEGGKNLLVGSVELERYLFQDWGVSVFYDAGNAFNDLGKFSVYQGAGVGAHYYTRIGGLNLYLARQVGVNDPALRVHFTVGFEL